MCCLLISCFLSTLNSIPSLSRLLGSGICVVTEVGTPGYSGVIPWENSLNVILPSASKSILLMMAATSLFLTSFLNLARNFLMLSKSM